MQKKVRTFKVQTIRDLLREEAVKQTELLRRSVGRLTSYDAVPCVEYSDEVESQRDTLDRILYLQECRAALEKSLDSGYGRVRHWYHDQCTYTWFKRVEFGCLCIGGLEIE